jgi:hypothetical protein
MSARYGGGGSGGGTGSLAFGIDIAIEAVGGEALELYEFDLDGIRNLWEWFESWT